MDISRLSGFISKLKRLKRRGWELRGINNPESVADHSYSVAVMSLVISEKLGLDKSKCMEMALLHDLQESITTDITPSDRISPEKKSRIERDAMSHISKMTGMPRFLEIWEEYEKNETNEAKLIHDLDKLEMLYQALDYETIFPEKNLSEFYTYVRDKLQLEESNRMFGTILNERNLKLK